jgi:hypothetical protein
MVLRVTSLSLLLRYYHASCDFASLTPSLGRIKVSHYLRVTPSKLAL